MLLSFIIYVFRIKIIHCLNINFTRKIIIYEFFKMSLYSFLSFKISSYKLCKILLFDKPRILLLLIKISNIRYFLTEICVYFMVPPFCIYIQSKFLIYYVVKHATFIRIKLILIFKGKNCGTSSVLLNIEYKLFSSFLNSHIPENIICYILHIVWNS